ncbi:hypothetical protein ABIA33_004788 [Streptacidiphilus sp. MAP12-16]|jgi:hypothetical protein|uniref:hypothetical protein n=1 Tax=Streptacidiphilus sp. MAP12-16 TaxID=3156300 RepID=UPI003514BB64
MNRVRPTLRCLREDFELPAGPVDRPLDEIDHPLLAKAQEQFADPGTPHERIAAVDDQVLFKVKVRRWRGAVWPDDPSAEIPLWLVAAGRREDGSATDFYAALAIAAKAARTRYNSTHTPALTTSTYTAHLLPDEQDRARYSAEAAARLERRLAATVHDLARASLLDGHEHQATVGGARLGLQIRANEGHETYVAVRITGSVPDAVTVTVLDLIPGCALDDWFPEYSLPERPLEAAEQAWSNLMDPIAAAKLLDVES